MSWSCMVLRARGIIAFCPPCNVAPIVRVLGEGGTPSFRRFSFPWARHSIRGRIGFPARRAMLYRDRGVQAAADIEAGA